MQHLLVIILLNHPDEIGILFEIHADRKADIIFADISRHSELECENEVLFVPNAVFRIDSVEFDRAISSYTVRMTATDEFKDCFQTYLSLQKSEMRYYQPMIYFGHILVTKMGERERAKRYFKMLLRKLSSNHVNVPLIYCQLGDLHFSEKKCNKALIHYEKAMNIYYDRCPTDYTDLVDCLLNIGYLYLYEGKSFYDFFLISAKIIN